MTLDVLVPSSLCREAPDKRAATAKLGQIARAATLFRVDALVVFDDAEGEREWGGGFVETVLRYAATPPYLRKEAFGTRDELEYVGVLPPLRVRSQTGSESSDSGSIREGIVTQVGSEGRVRVNCGLQHPVSLGVPAGMAVDEGERVTVRVSSRRPVRAKLLDAPRPGYQVRRMSLSDALDTGGVRIATSRHGVPLTLERLPRLAERLDREDALLAFGAPGRGLPPMLGVTPEDVRAAPDWDATADTRGDAPGGFDVWLNTVPDQGSEVVRTEEAVLATLATLTIR